MKKAIAVSLLFVFLGANTELDQLLKLPVLLHHFFSHQEQSHDESIGDFLKEHYSDSQEHSETEHHDHGNLPFKTNDCASSIHNNIAFDHQHNFSSVQPSFVSEKLSVADKVVFYSSAIRNKVWQPPQFI